MASAAVASVGEADLRQQIRELQKQLAEAKASAAHQAHFDEEKKLAQERASGVKSVDVCFVIDCTSSMKRVIDAVKQKFIEVKRFIVAYMGAGALVRLSVVGYRDHGHKVPLEFCPFTTEDSHMSKFLASLEPTSCPDPDECEDMISGLQQAVELEWRGRIRLLYVAADNPPHGRRFHSNLTDNEDRHVDDPRQWEVTDAVFKTIRDMGIHLIFLHAQSRDLTKMFQVFRGLMEIDGDCENLQILEMSNKVADFTRSMIRSCGDSLTKSLTNKRSTKGKKVKCEQHFFETCPVGWEHSHDWPQHEVVLTTFKTKTPQGQLAWHEVKRTVRLRSQPFAEGAMRYAFPAYDEVAKQQLVAKVYKDKGDWCNSVAALQKDAVTQSFAEHFAVEFSKLCCPVKYVPVQMMEITSKTQDHKILRRTLIEPFIQQRISGEYAKYTSNAGYAANDSDVAQAFSHFTWQHSGGRLMVTDIQGVGDAVFTDPQIHTSDPLDDRFGQGNLGKQGIDDFFLSHVCNELCQDLKLDPSPMQVPGLAGIVECLFNDCTSDEGCSDGGNTMKVPPRCASRPSSALRKVSLMCDGPCGTSILISRDEYNAAKSSGLGALCKPCFQQASSTLCRKSCCAPDCRDSVTYSVWLLNVCGLEVPMFCRECSKYDSGWEFVEATSDVTSTTSK
ncbi:unnamed protein product [Prorocentrum cordatum]|uniref:Alpha-type protein kinase domain-containing protein n=1 Tax=Prorocentrum cordatum TaxID=2364126 RepID=A0ABN9YA57_9DINO|nr:unnamed protein product [Polarella glacialis]